MNEFSIGRHTVGPRHPTYFVADIAANHDGELDRAVELIHLAAAAGAGAAKFQNFRAETIVSDYGFRSMDAKASHQSKWSDSVFEVYDKAALPLEWTSTLREACDEVGIDYLTAPYDLDLIAELSEHVAAWKLGSGDITWHEAIARDGERWKPLLIATGASSAEDVRAAMEVANPLCDRIVLMQCNTNYTASLENIAYVNLKVLEAYAAEYPDVVLGLSDHTPGHASVLGAITLGARVVEKHFTDDCNRTGPDHPFSLDPATWRDMVERARELEAAMGDGHKAVMENERETVVLQRRSVRAGRALVAGQVIEPGDLVVLRPCPLDAVPPYRMGELVGRVLDHDLPAGECVRTTDLRP